MAGISVDVRIEKIREKYKDRPCIWCDDKPKKDCNGDCECIFCCFPDKVYSWEEYPNLNECIRRDIQFFNDLFKTGLIREDTVARNWRRKQLPVLRSTGTEFKDWTAFDLETDGGKKLIPNSPEDFTPITPYSKKYPDRKRNDGYPYHCELCGEGYNTKYFIKNIPKKQFIAIGGVCSYAFHFSDQVAEDIKSNMLKIIRQIFHKRISSIQKQIKEKLASRPNDAWLKSLPKRLRDYHSGRVYIRPETLAELLLGLEEKGISIFDEKKKSKKNPVITKSQRSSERKHDEKSTPLTKKEIKESLLVEEYGIIILEIMKKLRGPNRYAVNRDQIIHELEKHGMPKIEIETNITNMLERNKIYEFTLNSYKISK